MDPREWLFDVRVVNRNLDKGVIDRKSLKEHLKTLPDLTGQFEEIEVVSSKEEHDGADAFGSVDGATLGGE